MPKKKKTGETLSLSACFFILYPLINIEKPSIKLRNAYRKTPFCSCGPHGGQLRALRFPYAGCTARSYGTKKTILYNRVLPTVSLLYIAETPKKNTGKPDAPGRSSERLSKHFYLYSSQALIAKSSGVMVQKALINALARRAFVINGILRSIAARRIL